MDPYLEGSTLDERPCSTLPRCSSRQLSPQIRRRTSCLTDPPIRHRIAREPRPHDRGDTSRRLSPSVVDSRPGRAPRGPGDRPAAPDDDGRARGPHITSRSATSSAGHLVTAIELLSPTNKRGVGRREYLRRRERFLRSDVHLLEIDLLRKGRRVPMLQEFSPPLLISSSSAGAEERPVDRCLADPPGSAAAAAPRAAAWPRRRCKARPPQALTMDHDECGFGDLIDYAKPPAIARRGASRLGRPAPRPLRVSAHDQAGRCRRGTGRKDAETRRKAF